jgi:hypothetical protein
VRHHQQGDAGSVQLFQQGHHFAAGATVKVAGRLIGQQDCRFHHHRATDGNALALATRQLLWQMPGTFDEVEALQDIVAAPPPFLWRHAS